MITRAEIEPITEQVGSALQRVDELIAREYAPALLRWLSVAGHGLRTAHAALVKAQGSAIDAAPSDAETPGAQP